MKELSTEQKAKAYDKTLERAKRMFSEKELYFLFPELRESEDERTRKALIEFFESEDDNTTYSLVPKKDILAWLEKQGEQNPIINVPSREVILAIWDLGNEWKELTNGSISTEYGTQLDYIQKHWHESEYYLREKQGEQNPADKLEDEEYNGEDYGIDSLFHAQRILEKTLGKVDGYQTDDGILSHKCTISAVKKLYEQKPDEWSEEDENMIRYIGNAITCEESAKYLEEKGVDMIKAHRWLESLRPQKQWKPTEAQLASLTIACDRNDRIGFDLTQLLKELKKL